MRSIRAQIQNELIYTDTDDVLNGAELDSGVFDTENYASITVRIKGFQGANQRITTSTDLAQTEGLLVSDTTIDPTLSFNFFTIPCRARYFRIQAQNNTGVTITDGYLEITGNRGGPAPASTFPLIVSPSSFSPAMLTQAVTIGQQPDGDFTNLPSDGLAFTTTSTLSAGATYTSDWTDTDGWNTIDIVVTADVCSEYQGLVLDFTDDANAGTPTTILSKFFTFCDNDVDRGFKTIRINPELDGFRVRYINGDTAQGSFNLSATLRVSSNNGKMNSGNVNITGSFLTEVALGNIDNYESGVKFGRNPDIDTGTAPEDIWNGGGDYTGFPTGSPETVDVFSSSGNDTSAGTGARTIRIYGLKTTTSTEYEEEDITMSGATAVTSTNTWYRINRAKVLTAGSGGENAGDITIRHTTTTANVFAQLPAGYNQTTIMAYTVPYNRKMLIKGIHIAMTRASGAAGSGTITIRCREPSSVFQAIRTYESSTSSGIDIAYDTGLVIPAQSDIKFRCESVSDNNTVITGEMEYVLLDELA